MGEREPFISESIYSEAFADIMLRDGRTRRSRTLDRHNTFT